MNHNLAEAQSQRFAKYYGNNATATVEISFVFP